MVRAFRAVCQGAMWASGSLGTREAQVPGQGQAGQGLVSQHPSPCPSQGAGQPGGSRGQSRHRAHLWGWGWAKARLGHPPTGVCQYGDGYKAARDVTPKRRGLTLMEASRRAVWEPPQPPDIRVMRGSPQLCYCRVGSEPQQPNLQEGEGCGQGPYAVLPCNNLSKHHPNRHAGLSSRGSLPFRRQACSKSRRVLINKQTCFV